MNRRYLPGSGSKRVWRAAGRPHRRLNIPKTCLTLYGTVFDCTDGAGRRPWAVQNAAAPFLVELPRIPTSSANLYVVTFGCADGAGRRPGAVRHAAGRRLGMLRASKIISFTTDDSVASLILQMVPGGGLGQYGMLLDDPTFTSIKQHAQDMLGCASPASIHASLCWVNSGAPSL